MPGYGNTRMPKAYIWRGQVPVTLLRINVTAQAVSISHPPCPPSFKCRFFTPLIPLPLLSPVGREGGEIRKFG
jgi:hypothetical protein